MNQDWHSKIDKSSAETVTATHLLSLLICIWAFLVLGVPTGYGLAPLLAIMLAACLMIVVVAGTVFFTNQASNTRRRQLFDSIYIILLLALILTFILYTGNADSPVRVLLLIPVIIISTVRTKRWGLATATLIGTYLLVASLLTDHSHIGMTFQLNVIYAGVMVLVAWLVGGFTDAEREVRSNLANLNQELERMISERTRELVLANRELKEKILDRKQAERLLRESEARFRSIFENASVGVALLDRDSVFLMINDVFCGFLGYSRGEILGHRLSQFLLPGEQALDSAPKAAKQGNERQGHMLELRFMQRDGEIVWGRLNISVIHDQQLVPQHKIIVCEDVTSLKTRESELNAQGRVFEAMHSALQELSRPPGLLPGDNPALANLAGHLQWGGYEEIVASKVIGIAREITGAIWVEYYAYDAGARMLSLVSNAGMPQELFEQARKLLQFTMDEERGFVNLVARQRASLYVPDVDVNPRWVKLESSVHCCYLVPLHYGENLFGVYALLSDRVNGFSQQQRSMADAIAFYISTAMENARLFGEVQQAFERINAIQQQLLQSQKMEAIGQLAGGIAHDLNNQLTVIQASVDLNMNTAAEDTPVGKALRRIRRASEKSANLIRQLLLFGRKHPQFKVLIDLNQNVSELQEMLERLLGEDVGVRLVLAPDLWAVRADATNIDQVIINIAINARDAMPLGGLITIRTENKHFDSAPAPRHPVFAGDFVCLSVSDTGMGIEGRHLPHIFEPFFTTKEPGKGTGLGLSVAYGIVDAHGGWIDVESVSGAGSTFNIYLPAAALVDEPEELGIEPLSPDYLRGSGESILLVEDDQDVAALTMNLLAENGYEVQPCRTVAEASRAFNQPGAAWDLVLCDAILPDGKGVSLIRQFRLKQPFLKAILFSGYADERASMDEIQREGLLFLPKPYAVVDLLRSVREAMGNLRPFGMQDDAWPPGSSEGGGCGGQGTL